MAGKDHKLKWSTTAASNTDIANIGIQGTNQVLNFDNALREYMKEEADGITRHVVKTVGSYTPVLIDHNQFWQCTGAVTLTLTAAATLTTGWCLWIKANGGAVTIDPNSTELINGQAIMTLGDGQSAMIICNGTAFHAVMQGSAGVPFVAQGRLTLTTALPVTTSDVTGAGTLYYTPYLGNNVTLWQSGPGWQTHVFSEISLALTLTSGKPYDVFLRNTGGVLALEVLVWTNDTTRATGLTRFEGRLVKGGDATGLYVGTIYASGSNTTEDSKAKRYVWNMYNRVSRAMSAYEATDNWTYSITTIRQANGAAANQLDFVRGLDEDMVRATASAIASGTAQVLQKTLIGLDATNAKATDSFTGNCNTITSGFVQMVAGYAGLPGVGRHFLAWLESSTASGTTTWNGDTGVPAGVQSGIVGDGLF